MSVAEKKKEVTILFAGDSGDGIQLTGNQFTATNALFGNDVSTFPDFPAEIRAPQGTVAGVSGFQLHFGSVDLYTPGDASDVIVAMNAASLKAHLHKLRKGGTIIANTAGFDKKNLTLAKYIDGENPLENNSLSEYKVIEVDVTKLTRAALEGLGFSPKDMDRSKNMFVLGILYWMYNRKLDHTIDFLKTKFKSKPEVSEANIKVLKAGYNFGDTSETFTSRYKVEPAPLSKGVYRNIMGNQALAIGLVAASKKANLDLFYGTYPITPASDILHELAKHKNFGVKTFQAEDEIAAICASIGASFGGSLGITASSGPGIALKGEAMGLAMMLEIPLVIVNVQRGGPSTGLPTKTEQSDLNQALYGRNGEAPIPIVAAKTPSDCFKMAFEAVRLAVEHMTPVVLLSDGYVANGSEPWRFPQEKDLNEINVVKASLEEDGSYLPYKRDERLVRGWAVPGQKDFQHRVGGLEKEWDTGNVSYDSANHEKMVQTRQAKVDEIANHIPEQEFELGSAADDVLVLGWGSTFGAIKTAVIGLRKEGASVAQVHLSHIVPFPRNFVDMIQGFKKIVVPELNNGQLVSLIKEVTNVEVISFTKVQGIPFTSVEIIEKVNEL